MTPPSDLLDFARDASEITGVAWCVGYSEAGKNWVLRPYGSWDLEMLTNLTLPEGIVPLV